MQQVDTERIRELRDKTGASIIMIKKALSEAEGDEVRALEILKSLGHEAAEKKTSRETKAGRVEAYVHPGERMGALLELRSETDFVARNGEFINLAHDVAMHITAMNPMDVKSLLEQAFIKDEKQTVDDLIKRTAAKFGENIEVKRFTRFEL